MVYIVLCAHFPAYFGILAAVVLPEVHFRGRAGEKERGRGW